jgi:hypothetical protein
MLAADVLPLPSLPPETGCQRVRAETRKQRTGRPEQRILEAAEKERKEKKRRTGRRGASVGEHAARIEPRTRHEPIQRTRRTCSRSSEAERQS